MDLNLTLTPEILDEITSAMTEEADRNSELLKRGPTVKIELKDGLREKLGKYIDFEAGGLRLLDVHIKGRPARFTLVPDVGDKSISVRFQYKF